MDRIKKPSDEVLEYIKERYFLGEGGTIDTERVKNVGWLEVSTRKFWRIMVKNRKIRRAHIVWFLEKGEWPSQQIDHIDRNSLNDRIENLREVDHFEQQRNKDSYRGYRGFSIEKMMDGVFRERNLKVRCKARGIRLTGKYKDYEEACRGIDRWWEDMGVLVGEDWKKLEN